MVPTTESTPPTATPQARRRNFLLQLALHSQTEIAAGRSGSDAGFAERIGVHPSMLPKLKGSAHGRDSRDISDKLARQIESRLGLEPGWLDAEHSDAPLTSAEASFVELALRVYRGAGAKKRRELRQQMQRLLDGESS